LNNASAAGTTVGRVRDIAIVSAAVVGLFAFIGFPLHDPDTIRYLIGAIGLKRTVWVPHSLPLLLHPLVMAIGPWAFILLNGVLLVAISAIFSITFFGRVHPIAIVVAILVSGAGLFSATVMMDIQTTFAVLALIVLGRTRSTAAWFILLIGILSHNVALVILPMMALLIATLFRSWRPLVAMISVGLVWLGITLAGSLFVSGKPSVTPNLAILFVTGRMMLDVPEGLADYAEQNPDGSIAAIAPAVEALTASDRRPRMGQLIWREDAVIPKDLRRAIADEAPRYLFFSLTRYPATHLYESIMNVYRSVVLFRLRSIDGILQRSPEIVAKQVDRFYPEYRAQMEAGLQYRSEVGRAYSLSAMTAAFLAALALCVAFIVTRVAFGRQGNRDLMIAVPGALLLYVLVNIFVVANFHQPPGGRFMGRTFYAPILFMCLAAVPLGQWIRQAVRPARSAAADR